MLVPDAYTTATMEKNHSVPFQVCLMFYCTNTHIMNNIENV